MASCALVVTTKSGSFTPGMSLPSTSPRAEKPKKAHSASSLPMGCCKQTLPGAGVVVVVVVVVVLSGSVALVVVVVVVSGSVALVVVVVSGSVALVVVVVSGSVALVVVVVVAGHDTVGGPQ